MPGGSPAKEAADAESESGEQSKPVEEGRAVAYSGGRSAQHTPTAPQHPAAAGGHMLPVSWPLCCGSKRCKGCICMMHGLSYRQAHVATNSVIYESEASHAQQQLL